VIQNLFDNIPEENVFRRFIVMAKENSVEDAPGKVDKSNLIANIPDEFLLFNGSFDLFKALQYIK